MPSLFRENSEGPATYMFNFEILIDWDGKKIWLKNMIEKKWEEFLFENTKTVPESWSSVISGPGEKLKFNSDPDKVRFNQTNKTLCTRVRYAP